MSQPLPTEGFKWVNDLSRFTPDEIGRLAKRGNKGYLLLLISPECVSLCLVFKSEVQQSKSHEHVSYPPIKQKMTALFQVTTRSGNGWREVNQIYQYLSTQMLFDMILGCHIRVDQYQNLKEGRFKTRTRQSALTNLIYTLV